MQDGRNWPIKPALSYSGSAALGSSTPWRPESVVSARITPLRLECFEQLPKHARRCVFWEVDPTALARDDHFADPEFEKEAWLSMVMLEWGACGQLAIPVKDDPDADEQKEDCEAPCVGFALYAPPGAVPRAGAFPTSPVSPDAVLLTSMGVEPDHPQTLARSLVSQAVADLMRRGVRALEAFGRTVEAQQLIDYRTAPPDVRSVVQPFGDCSFDQCMIEADFLLDVGFTVVAPHRYFPRLRLELNQGLGWKAEVEAALDRLLQSAQMQPVGAGAGEVTG